MSTVSLHSHLPEAVLRDERTLRTALVRPADAAALGGRMGTEGIRVPRGFQLGNAPADTYQDSASAQPAFSGLQPEPPDLEKLPEFTRLSNGLRNRVRALFPSLDPAAQLRLIQVLASDGFTQSSDRTREAVIDAMAGLGLGYVAVTEGFTALDDNARREVLAGIRGVVGQASTPRQVSILSYLGIRPGQDEVLAKSSPATQVVVLREISRNNLTNVPLEGRPDMLQRAAKPFEVIADAVAGGRQSIAIGDARLPVEMEVDLPAGLRWPSLESLATSLSIFPPQVLTTLSHVRFVGAPETATRAPGRGDSEPRQGFWTIRGDADGVLTVFPIRQLEPAGDVVTPSVADQGRLNLTLAHAVMHVLALKAWGNPIFVLTSEAVLSTPSTFSVSALPPVRTLPVDKFELTLGNTTVEANIFKRFENRPLLATQIARVLARLPAGSRAQLREVWVSTRPNGDRADAGVESSPVDEFRLRLGIALPERGPVDDGTLLSTIVSAWTRARPPMTPKGGSWETWDAANEADGIAPGVPGQSGRSEMLAQSFERYLSVLGTPAEAEARNDSMRHRFESIEELLRSVSIDPQSLRAATPPDVR